MVWSKVYWTRLQTGVIPHETLDPHDHIGVLGADAHSRRPVGRLRLASRAWSCGSCRRMRSLGCSHVTSGPEPASAPGPAPVALASDVAAASPTPVSPSSDPSVVVVVQPAQATPECAEPAAVKSDVMAAVQEPTPESATQAAATNPEPRRPQPAIVMPISAEPCEVAQALLVNSAGAGDAVSACLWLADVGTPTLRLVCAVGDAPEERTPIPVDEGILGESLASGENRCERIGCSAEDGGTRAGWRYAIPIADGEPSGVAVVNFLGDREPDLFALETLTQSLRGVFAGSLALHVSRAEAASARELIETVSDLSRLLDPEEVIDATLAHALTVSGADTASVMLVDGNSTVMHIARAHGLPEDVVRDTVVSEGEGIAGWVLASGRPLVVEDLEHLGPQSRRHGILSAASVPIADEDGVLGVLNVGSRSFHASSPGRTCGRSKPLAAVLPGAEKRPRRPELPGPVLRLP